MFIHKRNLVIIIFVLTFQHLFAGHPFRTDDACTIGKQSFQLELTPEVWKHANESCLFVPLTTTYGITENADVVLTVLCSSVYNPGFKSDLSGVNDIGLENKWRVLELEKFSLSVKPGIILPIGNYHIFKMKSDGSEQQCLSNNKNSGYWPSWSWINEL